MYSAPSEKAKRHANDEQHQRKKERRATKAESACLAEKRRSKKSRLNRLSSISGDGGSSKLDIECYSCSEKGHAMRNCPGEGKRKNDDSYSKAAKRSKVSLEL